VYVPTFRRNILPPSSGWLCLIDVNAYDTLRKIPEDHHMRNIQRENFEAYKKLIFFNVQIIFVGILFDLEKKLCDRRIEFFVKFLI
jgi:hypothetical protein